MLSKKKNRKQIQKLCKEPTSSALKLLSNGTVMLSPSGLICQAHGVLLNDQLYLAGSDKPFMRGTIDLRGKLLCVCDEGQSAILDSRTNEMHFLHQDSLRDGVITAFFIVVENSIQLQIPAQNKQGFLRSTMDYSPENFEFSLCMFLRQLALHSDEMAQLAAAYFGKNIEEVLLETRNAAPEIADSEAEPANDCTPEAMQEVSNIITTEEKNYV